MQGFARFNRLSDQGDGSAAVQGFDTNWQRIPIGRDPLLRGSPRRGNVRAAYARTAIRPMATRFRLIGSEVRKVIGVAGVVLSVVAALSLLGAESRPAAA